MTREFSVEPMAPEHCSIARVSELRSQIDMSPSYQRQGDIWDKAKKQLFIDSILNGFDIPKLYFHQIKRKGFRYAVVDGKQRLQAIWDFMDGTLPLSDEFEWFENPKLVRDDQRTLESLPPKVASVFTSFRLPIQVIYTDEEFWVESIFTRLNEATALNAPEKRNALGGPLVQVIRDVALHPFFTQRVPFPNNRYKHYELATKFLYLENEGDFAATKRRALDAFVKDFSDRNDTNGATNLKKRTMAVLDRLAGVFVEDDVLLKTLGLVVIYYVLERGKTLSGAKGDTRDTLANFDKLRRQVRSLMLASPDSKKLDARLVEFERVSQSLNDVTAMQTRAAVIKDYLENPGKIGSALKALK